MDRNKLLIIRYGACDIIQKALGDEWFVIKPGYSLGGRRFDLIINATQIRTRNEIDWFNETVKTKLPPEGKLFHVGE